MTITARRLVEMFQQVSTHITGAWRRIWTIALLSGALAACSTTTQQPDGPVAGPSLPDQVPIVRETEQMRGAERAMRENEIVRVALLLPFTSSSENIETISAAMLQAAQMVAFESDNARYLLIPKDTQGTAAGAAAVAREAVSEGADIILGPLFADSVTAVAQIARPNQIPVIAFSSDNRVAGEGVYLLSFPPEAEISRVTDYALTQGYARFGLMAPFSEFGDRVARSFSTEVFSRGGSIIHTERYERSADAMIAPARRMATYAVESFEPSFTTRMADPMFGVSNETATAGETQHNETDPPFSATPGAEGRTGLVDGYQALLLPEQGTLLRALAPLFPFYDVNVREVKLLGLSAWNNPRLTREPALNGGWFAAPDPALAEGFKTRYEAAYGEQPPRLASLAYDAALLTARLSQYPPETRFTPETIASPNGYLGADGLFRLRPNGMVERGLAILEIRPNGIQVIDPAPTSFMTPAAGTGF